MSNIHETHKDRMQGTIEWLYGYRGDGVVYSGHLEYRVSMLNIACTKRPEDGEVVSFVPRADAIGLQATMVVTASEPLPFLLRFRH